MTGLELVILGLLGLLVLEQAGAVVIFRFVCLRQSGGPASDHKPVSLVVLAVRGVDASLSQCVRALVRQKYPQYFVRVVLDSDDDPARAVD
jgi:hypothetical protein